LNFKLKLERQAQPGRSQAQAQSGRAGRCRARQHPSRPGRAGQCRARQRIGPWAECHGSESGYTPQFSVLWNLVHIRLALRASERQKEPESRRTRSVRVASSQPESRTGSESSYSARLRRRSEYSRILCRDGPRCTCTVPNWTIRGTQCTTVQNVRVPCRTVPFAVHKVRRSTVYVYRHGTVMACCTVTAPDPRAHCVQCTCSSVYSVYSARSLCAVHVHILYSASAPCTVSQHRYILVRCTRTSSTAHTYIVYVQCTRTSCTVHAHLAQCTRTSCTPYVLYRKRRPLRRQDAYAL
jgi:hypothetical protein